MIVIHLVVVCVASFVACVVCMKMLSHKRRRRRAVGVQLLQAIRMLIKHVQVHRGLMAVHFGGKLAIGDSIVLNIDTIGADLKNILVIDEGFSENENWLGLARHWAKLSAIGNNNQDAYENYGQHCKLVASSLELMLWTSKHYKVKGSAGVGGDPYWYELLSIGEKLGQLRALGLMCLSSTRDSDLKTRCVNKVEACICDVEAIIQSSLLQSKIGKLNSNEIVEFIDMVRSRIVQNKSWITEDQYFSRATETIEIIYKSFDDEMQRLLWVR